MSLIQERLLNCPKEPAYPKCEDCSTAKMNTVCPFYNGGTYARRKSASQIGLINHPFPWPQEHAFSYSTTLFRITEDVDLNTIKGTIRF